MDKRLKIALIVIGALFALYLFWNCFFKKPTKKPCPCEGDQVNEAEKIAVPEEKATVGETTVSINYGKDYGRTQVNNYYLTYTSPTGEVEVKEITASAYLQFLKDYPSEKAEGNVIEKYII